MCDKEINKGLPNEQQQQRSEDLPFFIYVFASHTGGERGFGLMNLFLMILKRIPEPC